jgi:glycosyltransferase involved in cell wall biosynthesis
MQSLNVLLVTYSFPPAGGVGVLRATSLARYLPSTDIRLDVLTTRNAAAVGTDLALVLDIPPEVTVHRSLTFDLPFSMRKRFKRLVSSGGKRVTVNRASHDSTNFIKAFLQDLLLPDPQVAWLPIALRKACKIIVDRKIQLVLITVPPFSCSLLVHQLRRRFPDLPLIIDFRDEWLSTTINLVSFSNRARAQKVARKAEASAIASSTAIVAVTESARREIRSRYPGESEEKFQVIPNGFDSAISTRMSGPQYSRGDGKILITFVGTLYRSTDPIPVIRALQRLSDDLRAQLRIRFIGYIEDPLYREALLSLGRTVELTGFVAHSAAIKALGETDYVLLITHDRINVPAKFYDYIGSGRPILAAIHPDSEVRRLLEDVNAGWWADVGDVDQIQRLLKNAIQWRSTLSNIFAPDRQKISTFTREALSLRYAALLKGIAAQVRHPNSAVSCGVAVGGAIEC